MIRRRRRRKRRRRRRVIIIIIMRIESNIRTREEMEGNEIGIGDLKKREERVVVLPFSSSSFFFIPNLLNVPYSFYSGYCLSRLRYGVTKVPCTTPTASGLTQTRRCLGCLRIHSRRKNQSRRTCTNLLSYAWRQSKRDGNGA